MLVLNKLRVAMRGSALIKLPASHTTLGRLKSGVRLHRTSSGSVTRGVVECRLPLAFTFEVLEESVRRSGGIKADSLSAISSVIASAAVVLQLAAIQLSIQ